MWSAKCTFSFKELENQKIRKIGKIWTKKSTINRRNERLKKCLWLGRVVHVVLILIFVFFFGLDWRCGLVFAADRLRTRGQRRTGGQTDKMRTQTRAEFIKTHRIRTLALWHSGTPALDSIYIRWHLGRSTAQKPPEPEARHETWASKPPKIHQKKNKSNKYKINQKESNSKCSLPKSLNHFG